MTHIEFSTYHNKLIRFQLGSSSLWHSGVVLFIADYSKKKYDTHYTFIPVESLLQWKAAFKNEDSVTMDRIEREVDINKISRAEIIDLSKLHLQGIENLRPESI